MSTVYGYFKLFLIFNGSIVTHAVISKSFLQCIISGEIYIFFHSFFSFSSFELNLYPWESDRVKTITLYFLLHFLYYSPKFNFWHRVQSQIKHNDKSSHSEEFLRKGVLKAIWLNPVNLLHIFRTLFLIKTAVDSCFW